MICSHCKNRERPNYNCEKCNGIGYLEDNKEFSDSAIKMFLESTTLGLILKRRKKRLQNDSKRKSN